LAPHAIGLADHPGQSQKTSLNKTSVCAGADQYIIAISEHNNPIGLIFLTIIYFFPSKLILAGTSYYC
jgi:hypothetical protein